MDKRFLQIHTGSNPWNFWYKHLQIKKLTPEDIEKNALNNWMSLKVWNKKDTLI